MALLFIDSSDHYATAQVTDKYTGGSGTVAAGRHGNGLTAYNLTIAPVSPDIASAHVVVGEAIYPEAFAGDDWWRIGDINTEYFTVDVLGDGSVRATLFGGSTVSSVADVVKLNQWYFAELECDVTVNTYAGPTYKRQFTNVKVYLDGDLVIDEADMGETVAETDTPTTYGWNFLTRGSQGGCNHKGDDFYLLDGSGGAPFNTVLGDIEIDVVRPNGAGATTQWTSLSAGANYLEVDDTTPDDDTSYNSAATTTLLDLFELENINTGNGIIGFQVLISAKRSNEGFASLTPVLRQTGVNYDAVTRTLSSSYFYRNRDLYVLMPDGTAITDARFNALQAGYRRDT
jgi:hypothetical protein